MKKNEHGDPILSVECNGQAEHKRRARDESVDEAVEVLK